MAQVNDNYVYLTAMNTIRNNLLEISVLFLERRGPWNNKQLAFIKLNFMLDRQIDGQKAWWKNRQVDIWIGLRARKCSIYSSFT